MSDEIEIRGGGAIAVDTETLRMTATRFAGVVGELDEIASRLGSVQNMLFQQSDVADGAVSAASVLSNRLVEVAAEADDIAASLRETASIYELVELEAEHGVASAAGDTAALQAIAARRSAILHAYPDAGAAAWRLAAGRAVEWPADLVRSMTELGYDLGGLFGPLEEVDVLKGASKKLVEVLGIVPGAVLGVGTILGATAFGVGGWGRLSRDFTLAPGRDDVAVRAVAPTTSGAAPKTLAAVAARVPGEGDSRVRVEKYTMPDKTTQYVAYVSGSRSWDAGGAEAWDAAAVTDLAGGTESASYQATVAALDAAGARPGDPVIAVGHSQGAWVAGAMALDGPYDVTALVSLGSPVEAEVGPGTLSVTLRHTDDAVTAVAGGGSNGAVGAPGSIVVERSTHVPTPVENGGPGPHAIESYIETARLVDESRDPRVAQLHGVLAELGTATKVEVTEFGAERLPDLSFDPPSAGGAGGSRRPS